MIRCLALALLLFAGDVFAASEEAEDAHIAASAAVHGQAGTLLDTTTAQTLSNKTLSVPIIANFVNAQHSHDAPGGGGLLTAGYCSINGCAFTGPITLFAADDAIRAPGGAPLQLGVNLDRTSGTELFVINEMISDEEDTGLPLMRVFWEANNTPLVYQFGDAATDSEVIVRLKATGASDTVLQFDGAGGTVVSEIRQNQSSSWAFKTEEDLVTLNIDSDSANQTCSFATTAGVRHIVCGSDNTWDIGTSSLQFNDGHFGGTMNVGGLSTLAGGVDGDASDIVDVAQVAIGSVANTAADADLDMEHANAACGTETGLVEIRDMAGASGNKEMVHRVYKVSCETTDATTTNAFAFPKKSATGEGGTLHMDVRVMGHREDGTNSDTLVWHAEGSYRSQGSGPFVDWWLEHAAEVVHLNQTSGGSGYVADMVPLFGAVVVQVTGAASETVNWNVIVETVHQIGP